MPNLFTNRRNGNSHCPYDSFNLALHVGDDSATVISNRKLLAQSTGPLQFMNQVHGDVVVEVTSITDEPTCDALVTKTPGIALAVMVADCIPLLLASASVVGAVHVGRRGLVNSIAIKTVEKMRELGAEQIHAILGPSICKGCYEVPQILADEVCEIHPAAAAISRKGTSSLDLSGALIADLFSVGVSCLPSSICTLEDPEYFSYRRENITGRSAGVIWI